MVPLKLFYPYPENLPYHRAHDVYIFNNCASLARHFDTTLCVGNDSLPDEALARHYRTSHTPDLLRLPILRRNNPLGLSWKRPFYRRTQQVIEKERPDVVLASVLKQGLYHWKRKVAGVRYVYEVHQLSHYPHAPADPKVLQAEKEMLANSDLVVVTVAPLKELLRKEPYNLDVPIEVVPLGVNAERLPPPLEKPEGAPVTVAYVGQCYPLQGVELVLDALTFVPDVRFEIIGGLPKDLERLKAYAQKTGVGDRVHFHGFQPPSQHAELLTSVDGFVMPSKHLVTNPHVAYTKLYEYASWGRPLIAPNCKAVLDHLGSPKGILFYQPENPQDLALCLEHLSHLNLVEKLGQEMERHEKAFSWELRGKKYANVLTSL